MTIKLSVAPFQVSHPSFVPAGTIVIIQPDSGATATVEYTKGSAADIQNNVATWAAWAKGTVSTATQDIVGHAGFIRVTALGGNVAVAINKTPTPAETGALMTQDWGTAVQLSTEPSGNVTGLVADGVVTRVTTPRLPSPFLLEDFESTTGWTPLNGTVSQETTRKVLGSASLKLTGTNTGTTVQATKSLSNVVPSALNVIAMLVDRQTDTNVSQFSPQVLRGGTSGQVVFADMTSGTPWTRTGKRWLAFNINDMPTVTALTPGLFAIRPKVDQTGDNLSVTNWDACYANAAGRPTVVLTFDDATDTIYNTVYPEMKKRGLRGTMYIPSAQVGLAGKMPLAQIQEIYTQGGWDVGCNSTNDTAFTSMTDTPTALTDIQNCQHYLASNGMHRGIRHFCWPNGSWNESLCAAFSAAGFKSGRTTQPLYLYDRFGIGDIAMTIGSRPLQSTHALSVATGQLTTIKSVGATQFFLFHDISESPTANGWQTSKFVQFLDALKADSDAGLVDVLTVTQWWDRVSAATLPMQ